MKNISTALKTALEKDSVIERDYIILQGTTDRIYLWFKFYDDCYKDGNIVQNFIMKRIEFDYADSDINFNKKEFKAYKEYKLEDGNWEAIDYGTFIVADVVESDTKETVKITAYDLALRFANTYQTDLDYANGTITLLDVFLESCDKCGVDTDITSFENSDFIVDSNQFENTAQHGNVISAIAGVSCNFAKIVDDKVKLIFTNETDLVIDVSDYEEFNDKRDTHPITVIGLGLSNIDGENVTERWEDGITVYGENYLTINDNPFAYTQAKRQQLITAIYNKAKGFAYSSITLKNCLYPHLQPGDLVKVRNIKGELVDTIILRTAFEDVQSTLESPSITKATVEYENPVTAIDIAKNTQIIVNKQEQIINAVVEETTANTSKIVQQQQGLDGINMNLQQAGGLNLIQDSTLHLGFADNIKIGTVTVEQNKDIIDNTTSKSAIKIVNGSVQFAPIKIKENTDYTFSCIIYKNELTNVKVKIATATEQIYNLELAPNTFTTLDFTVNSPTTQAKIEIISDNNYAYFCDCMFNQGGKLGYQLYQGEVIGENYQFGYNGLEIESTAKNTKSIFGADGTIIKNKETGKVVAEFNGENTVLDRVTVENRLNIGKARFTVLQNGKVGVSWDTGI